MVFFSRPLLLRSALIAGQVFVAATASPLPIVAAPIDGPSSSLLARDADATRAFRAGRWDEAAAAFRALFDETKHPIYLRNIARCHQMRREPEEALSYFRRYLDARPEMSGSERREVKTYIAEMERLKTVLEAGSPPPMNSDLLPLSKENASPPVAVPPVIQPNLSVSKSAAPTSTSTAFYKSWWFWTATGVVVASVGATFAYMKFSRDSVPACQTGFTCMKRP